MNDDLNVYDTRKTIKPCWGENAAASDWPLKSSRLVHFDHDLTIHGLSYFLQAQLQD